MFEKAMVAKLHGPSVTTASLILGSSPIKRDTEYYYFADMQIKNHHPTAVIQEGDGNGLSSEHM